MDNVEQTPNAIPDHASVKMVHLFKKVRIAHARQTRIVNGMLNVFPDPATQRKSCCHDFNSLKIVFQGRINFIWPDSELLTHVKLCAVNNSTKLKEYHLFRIN